MTVLVLNDGVEMPLRDLRDEGNKIGRLDALYPGVRGYAMRKDGIVYIPLIEAEAPGHGATSRFLSALPRDTHIRVPIVLSTRLAGMLARRGFHEGYMLDLDVGLVEFWERGAD